MRIHYGLSLALIAATTWAQQPPAQTASFAMPTPARGPSLELALEAAQTVVNTCHAQGHDVAALVVDSSGGTKVALVPDSKPASVLAFIQRKVAVAMEFKMNSADAQALAKTDKTVADKIAANSNMVALPGAVLLKVGNEIIGVLAAGGSAPTDDEACAQAGFEKIKSRLR